MIRLRKLLGWTRRRPHHFLRAWIAVALLVLLWAVGYNLLAERRQIVSRTEALTQNYADTIANRIEASIAKVDVLLSLVAKDYAAGQSAPGRQVLTNLFEQALRSHPEIVSVMVIRRDGSLDDYSRPQLPSSLNFRDRAYFQHHERHPGKALHVGAPIQNRIDGSLTVPVSMRLDDVHGNFAGVVFIGLSVGYFDREFATLRLGRAATIAISDSEGVVLFRSPAVPGAIGKNIGNWDVFRTVVRHRDSGAGDSVCPVDGVERIHAFRRLHRYPLIAYAGISQSELQAEWLAQVRFKLPLLLAALALLAASGLMIYRQLLREAKTKIRLKASLRHADLASHRALLLNDALQKSSNLQEAILHSTSCGIFATDVNGAVLFINRATTKILGFRNEEVVGKRDALAFHCREEVQGALDRIREGDVPYLMMVAYLNAHPGRQWQFVRHDGATVPVSISITSLKDRDGRLDGFVTIFHDLTERNRLDSMKSDFVSVVSHELRTPLTAIRGALSLHRAALGDAMPAAQQRLVGIAVDNCDKLVRIVSDILDIDKLAHHRLELSRRPESVAELVGRAIIQTEPFAAQFGVRYRMVTDPAGLRLSLDADRFIQIMVNLLSNAAKFSHPDGEVLVSVSTADGRALIRVADEGVGMPEAFYPFVFERFSQHAPAMTRKAGGTGLGLAITKLLVEAHGGSIGFRSCEGVGTTFEISLPLLGADGSLADVVASETGVTPLV